MTAPGGRGSGGLGQQPEAQVAQLAVVDGRRCVGERILARLRLREGDDLTDVLLAGEQGDEAVDPEGEAGVGRGAVAERLEQEPELALLLLRRDPEQLEDPLLDARTMDPHRAGAQLPTVQHQVVGLAAGGEERLGRGDRVAGTADGGEVLGVGHREGVVGRDRPAGLVVDPLEEREVDDPQEVQATLVPVSYTHLTLPTTERV